VAEIVLVAFQIVVSTARLVPTYSLTPVALADIIQAIALCAQASGRAPKSSSVAFERMIDEDGNDGELEKRMRESLKRVAVMWDRISRMDDAGPKDFILRTAKGQD
jgi:hypothetical protein